MIDAVAMHTVRQFIILDETFGIETADRDQRRAAKCSKGAGDQQQAVDLHPSKTRDDVADIFVGLKKFHRAPSRAGITKRHEDAAGSDEFGVGGKSVADAFKRTGFEERVGIERQDDICLDPEQRRIERLRLAHARQLQPLERRMRRAALRRCQPVAIGQHPSRIIGRAVISNQNRVGLDRLREDRI